MPTHVTWAFTGYLSGRRLPELSKLTRVVTGYLSGYRLPEWPQVIRVVTGYLSGYRLPEWPQVIRVVTGYLSSYSLPDFVTCLKCDHKSPGLAYHLKGHKLPEGSYVASAVTSEQSHVTWAITGYPNGYMSPELCGCMAPEWSHGTWMVGSRRRRPI